MVVYNIVIVLAHSGRKSLPRPCFSAVVVSFSDRSRGNILDRETALIPWVW